MKNYFLINLMSIVALLTGTVVADSFFSSAALGLPHYVVSAPAIGMGGAGIGVRQYLTLNEMNPAAVDLKGMSMVTAGLQAEAITHTIGDASTATRQANAAGFRLAVPIKSQFAVMFAFKPRTATRYTVDSETFIGDDKMTRTLDGKGGLNAVSLGGHYVIVKGVVFGAMFDYYFGTFQELWKTDFDNPDFLDTRENASSNFYGKGVQVGLFLQPWKALSFGAVFSSSSRLNAETSVVTGGGKSLEPVKQKADYPAGVGLGTAVTLNKFLITADLYQQWWTNFKIDGVVSTKTADYFRAGVGAEYCDAKDDLADYLRRISYRLGGYYARLPFVDGSGEQASELIATLGLGFPFKKNAGRIDLALEVGERSAGSAYPYSEKILRFSAYVTGAERWFIRNY